MTIFQDEYRSRCGTGVEIRPRKDPVVYRRRRPGGRLSHHEIETYERDGYLSIERALDAKVVSALGAEMERLRREAEPDDGAVVLEPSSHVVRSIFAVHRRSSLFDRVVRHMNILGMVEQILGGPVYVHQSRINYKSGFEGEQFHWHSDFETWHVEDGMPRMRAVSVSIALSDNTPLNGPLMLIPGSHHYYVTCVGETPPDHYRSSLRRQERGVPDGGSVRWLADRAGRIAAPVGPAGSLILFDCNTMHGSNSNITPFPRSNLFIVYNSIDNGLVEPFGGMKPRPDFIASRNVEPVTAA
jgi:ectoine hydroxylase